MHKHYLRCIRTTGSRQFNAPV